MSFLYPQAFWLFLLLAPVFMKKSIRSLRFTALGYIATFVFIVIAISRPVIEQEPIKNKQHLSDVVVGVDLSYSMQATDIAPTRLERAKELLKELVKAQTKTRFGVLGFTTSSVILSPLTTDSELLLHLFESLDEKLIITKGSDVMPALKLARKMSDSKRLSVVLLTDGADEFDYDSEALFAKENSMIVNILMLATKMGGTLSLKNGELLKDETGDIVVSRENSSIKLISDSTGGLYSDSLSDILNALENQRIEDENFESIVMQNIELFYYFIAMALVSFLVSITSLKKFVIAFFLLFGVSLNADIKEYLNEMFDENRANFNKATTYYRAGMYEKALESFEKVKSSNEEMKSVVYYNIGNSLIRLQEFEKARDAYVKSLTLFISKEALENLEFIKDVGEKEEMSTGQQKAAQKSALAQKRKNSKKAKDGGSSNMKVSANASQGADESKKKNSSKVQINLNSAKAKLSSKQYELINKRVVNEQKPW